MPDYKEMYFNLLRDVDDALKILDRVYRDNNKLYKMANDNVCEGIAALIEIQAAANRAMNK